MTKKLLIGVGILAGAGLAYYFWKKNKESEGKSEILGRRRPIVRGRVVGLTAPVVVVENGSANREVLVGSNFGALSCPRGQHTCSRDVNSCCRFVPNV